jgi:hypothetical protein
MSYLITPLVDMDHCHILTLDNQFYCFKCKKATLAKQGTLERTTDKRGRPQNKALCIVCEGIICQFMPRKTSDT